MARERPILVRPPLVRAILQGEKTQTRRPAKEILVHHTHQDGRHFCSGPKCSGLTEEPGAPVAIASPYGMVGDRLWVREAWHAAPHGYCYLADKTHDPEGPGCTIPEPKWRPSIHMPREACRVVLKVTDVRLQPLSAISYADALAEGTWREVVEEHGRKGWVVDPVTNAEPVRLFREAWDRAYAKRGFGWAADPWVWAITFRRVSA